MTNGEMKSYYDVTSDTTNFDIPVGVNRHQAKEYYMNRFGNFVSKLPSPVVFAAPERDDIFIIDYSQGPCGFKAYCAEKMVSEVPKDVILGYAAPRVGHAPEAIAFLAEMYDLEAVFFAPSSKQVSAHQAVVRAYDADLRFVRIPAMPCLNSWIRDWAKEVGGAALPFGLSHSPDVTAGMVAQADTIGKTHGFPPEFYCAVSTGTMIRGLQIGWPDAKPVGVAVARNIKKGEIGDGNVTSYWKHFYKGSDYMPEFDTTSTYDAKCYKRFIDEAKPGSYFINVGSDKQIEHRLNQLPGWEAEHSFREWGDQSAFEYRAN